MNEQNTPAMIQIFCESRNIQPDALAPHIHDFLSTFNPEKLARTINRLDVKENSLTQEKRQFDSLLAQVPHQQEMIVSYLNSDLPPPTVQRAMFDFLEGVQFAYKEAPYAPKAGLLVIEDGKSRASYEYNASMTEQTGDRIVITPERLRHFALYDNTSISRESWFKSDHIKFNQAYYAGMEEQHHAFDIGERQIQKREGMIYDSPVYDKDSYYLADLAELSSAVRQMDAYFNYRQGEKLSGRFPEGKTK